MNKISPSLGITIIIVIVFIVGGVLAYQCWWLPKQEVEPSIKIISPNGGETWEIGKTYSIKWSSSYSSTEKVTIVLQDTRYSPDSESPLGEAPVAVAIPNTGNYNWTTPSSLTDGLGRIMTLGTGNIYKITVYLDRIGGECKVQRCDVSDAPFSIVAAGAPYITVLSPNGGETWEIGKSYTVKWQSSMIKTVNIQIRNINESGVGPSPCDYGVYLNHPTKEPISAAAGSFTFKLEMTGWCYPEVNSEWVRYPITPRNNQYKIRILGRTEEALSPLYDDTSDAPFTIK